MSVFTEKNARRKAGRSNGEAREQDEARARRRGLCGENSRTFGAFGHLTGAEYNRHIAGTTASPKSGAKQS